MTYYCTKCGKHINYDADTCDDCSVPVTVKERSFADPVEVDKNFDGYHTRPLDQTNVTAPIERYQTAKFAQNFSQCRHCGGAGGISTKSTISTGGFVYMGIMFSITLLAFLIFFPCALIPFGLFFLGFLFKETHFACVNCGQRSY